MSNPYKQLKEIIEKHGLDMDDVIHALMATVYPKCCDHCSETLRSETFMQDFDHMAEEFQFCKVIASKHAA
jgi:hypothetical protein